MCSSQGVEEMLVRNGFGVVLSIFMLTLGSYWLLRATPDSQALRFAVAELDGLESLEREFGSFRDMLIRDTGLSLRFHSVPNRIAATEALISGQVDLLVVGPSEYVTIAAKSPVQIVMGLRRAEYYCVFITTSNTNINSLADLRGKKVAIGDPGSTSKHLAPLLMLDQVGIETNALKLIHTSSVQLGWEALLAGDVDAFATTSDKYYSLLNQCPPETKSNIRLLEKGEDLPGDLIIASKDLSGEIVDSIRSAILKNKEAYIQAICTGVDNQKYRGMTLSGDVGDADYDSTRRMVRLAGMEELLKTK
jgi:phosphonate transport system substrate-binding protein